MDDILDRFIAQAPLAVLVRATLAQGFADTTLDALFDRKNPRGPKQAVAIKRTRRGAHRSTARLLQEKRHKK